MEIRDPQAAKTLAAKIDGSRPAISVRVAARLLAQFPELVTMLRTLTPSPAERLSAVAVDRFAQLVRAMLLFRQPMLADKEFAWAIGVLPRFGVRYEHQSAMTRWFFEELRTCDLTPAETELVDELDRYLFAAVGTVYEQP